MAELVTMVSEKTGISEEMAEKAVGVVIGYLKGKLPDSIAVHHEDEVSLLQRALSFDVRENRDQLDLGLVRLAGGGDDAELVHEEDAAAWAALHHHDFLRRGDLRRRESHRDGDETHGYRSDIHQWLLLCMLGLPFWSTSRGMSSRRRLTNGSTQTGCQVGPAL